MMGTIFYGDARHPVPIEDRALTHLKAVIIGRLRRGESCSFSWSDGSTRETIWLSPSIPLHFVFESAGRPPLNRMWIELLAHSASSPAGLHLMPEPEDDA